MRASFPGLKVDSFIRKPYKLADLAGIYWETIG